MGLRQSPERSDRRPRTTQDRQTRPAPVNQALHWLRQATGESWPAYPSSDRVERWNHSRDELPRLFTTVLAGAPSQQIEFGLDDLTMPLSEERYFQLASALPIALPTALFVAVPRPTLEKSLVVVILEFSLVFAGLPYLLFAVIALRRLRGAPAAAYRRFARLAPLYFALPLGIVGAAAGFVADAESGLGSTSFIRFIGMGLLLAIIGVVVGYGYVVVTEVLRLVLIFARWIAPPEGEVSPIDGR